MKKRWIPFLLKLFLPGLLALPWVLNIIFGYLPMPYYENNSWYDMWPEPIALLGLLLAVIAPLFLLRQKPKRQARDLAARWFIFAWAILSSSWMPIKLFLEGLSFVVVPVIVMLSGFLLIAGYRSFYFKIKDQREKSLRFHTVLVVISILVMTGYAIFWVIAMRIPLFRTDQIWMDFAMITFNILEKCLYGISILATLAHYDASIKHFRYKFIIKNDLIEEIGAS